MRVTFFLYRFPVASETFILNQIVWFMQQGHDVGIISVFPGDLKNAHPQFRQYELGDRTTYLMPERTIGGKKRLLKRAAALLPHLVHPRTWKSLDFRKYGENALKLVLPTIVAQHKKAYEADVFVAHFGPVGALANELREFKVLKGHVATVFHGYDLSRRNTLRAFRNNYDRLLRGGDLFLPISNLWGRTLVTLGADPAKIKLVRMGVDVESFNFEPRRGFHRPLRIVTVARLTEKKGIDVAIEACALLRQWDVDFEYVIVGDGDSQPALSEAIRKADLAERVKLLGFKPQNEVRNHLMHADLFLLPSKTAADGDMEGIPVALMEAMATGLPVVSTEHSGIPELIQNGVTGWTAKEGDALSLANLLKALATGEGDDLSSITQNARKAIEQNFNLELEYRKLSGYLEGLV